MLNYKLFRNLLALFVILNTQVAGATLYATRTQSESTAILIENLDSNSAEFQNLCQIARDEVTKWSTIVRPPMFCVNSAAAVERLKESTTRKYGTVLQMTNKENQLTLSFHGLTPDDPIYPSHVIKGDFNKKDENFVHALHVAIADYGAFDRNRVAIREHFIRNYVAAELIEAKQALPENKNIKSSDISVEQREFENAYADFNRTDPENKRYLAASLMSAAILGVGTINYYLQHNPNVPFVDDDYATFGESMRARADFSAVRFDDNTQLTNIGHMYAGTLHYTMARQSGLNRWESLLHTAVLSSLWEYISEYKQSVSLNDQISTTLGGFIIGESFHQLTRVLKKDGGSPLKKFLGNILGGPEKLSKWIENTARGKNNDYDVDLSSAQQDFWSRMGIYLNTEKRNGTTVISGGLESEIVNIPKFDQPGEVAELLLDDTVQSQLKVEMGRGTDLKTFKLFAKTTLAAFYKKKMQLTEDDKLKGYQFFVGPAMMVDIDAKLADGTQSGPKSDLHGVIGVVGNTLDMRAVSGDLQIHAVIDVYGDFGIVRSLAFHPATNNQFLRPAYVPSNCDGFQSVMCNYSYYYGLGWTSMARFDLRYKKISAGVDSSKTSLHSIEGLSRFGAKQRLNSSEKISKNGAWIAYEINRDLRVELGVEQRSHVSRTMDKTVTVKEAITRGRLILKLD